ncbi:hypothetical protein F2P56_023571 [Juglans regia]|uniref:Uncharacterized protein n=1 Tax=Juglans regia TaxID=51240 RepID=A0A833UEE7_JUGRE|nr:hypothetical protein F2P56_023571 [Juglans regia]
MAACTSSTLHKNHKNELPFVNLAVSYIKRELCYKHKHEVVYDPYVFYNETTHDLNTTGRNPYRQKHQTHKKKNKDNNCHSKTVCFFFFRKTHYPIPSQQRSWQPQDPRRRTYPTSHPT